MQIEHETSRWLDEINVQIRTMNADVRIRNRLPILFMDDRDGGTDKLNVYPLSIKLAKQRRQHVIVHHGCDNCANNDSAGDISTD
jgi:hypothetical protein